MLTLLCLQEKTKEKKVIPGRRDEKSKKKHAISETSVCPVI